jgi:hypothetical protein
MPNTIQLTDKQKAGRAAYIEGMRALADLLEQNPDLPLPYNGQPGFRSSSLHIASGKEPATGEMLASLLGRPVNVEVRADALWVTWQISGFAVQTSVPVNVGEKKVVKIVKIGDRSVPQEEYVIPERFTPEPATAAVAGVA